MKSAIMQPYFFPYIGYFQLMQAVDIFVVYDNIQFTKKGWIQRNRILLNNKPHTISLPVTKASSKLNINQRYIADSFIKEKEKLKRQIQSAYRKAPYFDNTFELVSKILDFENYNLFDFLYNSLVEIKEHLDIKTRLLQSGKLPINIEEYKGQEKVIEIVKSLQSNHYINAIGGQELYDKDAFAKYNIHLNFIKTNEIIYNQFNNNFVPNLSIIDVMMFNDAKTIVNFLNAYQLI